MYKIIILVFMHGIGDFVLQGERLSKAKATFIGSLLSHVGIYTVFFMVFSPLVLGLTIIQGLVFSLINGSAHLLIDYFTSKFKKKYWKINETKYFTAIGIDHTLHIIILIFTYLYLFPAALPPI
jgi:hypothetical protein